VTVITVTATYLDMQGNPQFGTVSFTAQIPATFTDSSDGVFLEPKTVAAELGDTGALSVTLPTTDASSLSPVPFTYLVEEQILGSPTRSYSISVPHSLGSTVSLANLTQAVPVTHAPGITVLVPAPTGQTTADTLNVTAAIGNLTAALAYGPATLLFQDGTYQVDSNTAVIRSASNFTVSSGGRTAITQAPNRSGLPNNVTGDLFIIADCTDFRVEGITFDGLRDTVAPMTPLTSAASSGQPSVTVAAGNGSRYLPGQRLFLFGGLGTSEQEQSEGFSNAGAVTPLVIASIAPGGGIGGGDLITFTTDLSHSYAQIASTPVSDGFGPYAYEGAYLTPYQCGSATVAGRSLFGEDQQNGLHLLNCQRFVIDRVTSRNLWESPVRLGSGYEPTSLTDGCQQGIVTDCTGCHAYDQGVAVWASQNITVKGCVLNATGWAGISLTGSDYCTVTGNQIVNAVYRVPGDTGSGSGIVTEGGLRNQISKNIINSPYQYGIETIHSPLTWGLNNSSLPSTSTFLEAGTAGGTSVQVSSTANMEAGGRYSLLDGPRTEAVTVSSIVDGTHVEFSETLSFSHASGTSIGSRTAQENVIEGNTIRNAGSQGIMLVPSVRGVIKDNTVTGSGSYGIAPDYTVGFRPNTAYPSGDGSHIEGNVVGNGAGAGIRANGVADLQVRGNRIYSPNGFGAAIELHGVTGSIVAQNHITDIRGSYGIIIESGGPSSTPSGKITVSGNAVTRCQLQGIIAELADSLAITGNIVQSCSSGIDLQGVTNSVIGDNIANSNSGTGILLENSSSTGCTNCRVTGNTTRDDGTGTSVTSGASFTQQHGIVENGNSDNNLFTGNETDSNAVDQLTTTGAGTQASANIISGAISPAANAAPAAFLPANPADTTSTTLVMMGLGTTCTYTPSGSGIVLVNVSGFGYQGGSSVNSIGLGPRYGTGTAPANGAAVTGTRFGCTTDPEIRPSATGIGSNGAGFAFTALLALTPGTAYWFDIAALTTNASDPSALQNVSMTFAELP
jgi:parallel beta-helix repeat protein